MLRPMLANAVSAAGSISSADFPVQSERSSRSTSSILPAISPNNSLIPAGFGSKVMARHYPASQDLDGRTASASADRAIPPLAKQAKNLPSRPTLPP